MDKFVNVFKAFFAFLTDLLKNVGVKGVEDYKTDIENLFDAAAAALKKDEE